MTDKIDIKDNQEDGFYFKTCMISLKVNGKFYDFGRFVIDFFKCPECGWFNKFHHFFDKETIEETVARVRIDNPDAKKGELVIIYPYDGDEYHFGLGEYKLGKSGFNYKVDVNEKLLEEAKKLIGDIEYMEALYED